MKSFIKIIVGLLFSISTFGQSGIPVISGVKGLPVYIVNGTSISQENFTTIRKNRLDSIKTVLPGKVDKEIGKVLSKNDFTDLLKSKVDNTELRAQEISISVPTGLGINYTEYPFSYSLIENANGVNYGKVSLSAEAIFARYSTALSAPGATFYVSTTGNNSNDGLTSATAFRSIYKAIQVINASAVSSKVIILAGAYSRQSGFSFNFSVVPTVDIAFLASGGRVETGAFEEYTAPAIDATYANCYSFARSGVDRVIDMYSYDQYGNYSDFTKVNTAAECNATPNSYALISNTTVYINRRDRKPVTFTNSRVLLSGTTGLLLSSNNNIYLGGLTESDGFDFYGGGASGSMSGDFTTVPATKKAVVAKNCSFSYAGGQTQKDARGVSINGFHGLAFFQNCDASSNVTDGFNFHNISNINTAQFLAITVNCSGSNNGGLLLNSSCNGWTTHENVTGIDIAGYYQGNHGGSCRSVNASKNLFAGTFIKNDLGDIQGGGFMKPTGFRADDTTIYWLDRCNIDMPGSTTGLFTTASAQIYLKNMIPVRQAIVGNVSGY